MLWIVLLWSAAWAGPASKQGKNIKPAKHSLPPLPQQIENPNAYLYGYVMDVGVGTKGMGLTVVAIRPAGMHEAYWETLPICGKRGTDLNPAIGHWTVLIYSRDASTAGGGFCRELHSAKVVE
jgi:hypothetical protein